MYELIQVLDNCYYIQSPAKVGLVKLNEKEVCLIDSGNDKDAGKKIKKHLDANGWTLKAIYNTHSNADHIGGNRYLQNQTGCRIFAPGMECDFTNHPILESSYLYGGYPPKDLRHKFLLAQESRAEYLSDDNIPDGWEIIPLPGHFLDMVGYKTPDGIVYLADCVSSKKILEKYRIWVNYDVAGFLDTLEKIKGIKAKLFIPAHSDPTEDISDLCDYNRDVVYEIADNIIDIITVPKCTDDIIKEVFDRYNLTMSMEQYVLVGSTVRSYLSWLKDSSKVDIDIIDNRVLWKRI